MKIYIQTETPTEKRPRQLVLTTDASQPQVLQAFEKVTARLGSVTAIPPAAHEANLKAILPRDLAEEGITSGTATQDSYVLEVIRKPGESEVVQLDYKYTYLNS